MTSERFAGWGAEGNVGWWKAGACQANVPAQVERSDDDHVYADPKPDPRKPAAKRSVPPV